MTGDRKLDHASNPAASASALTLAGEQRESVTVIIAARNAADTIQRAVASALAQASAHQVMVVDDASNDQTAHLAQACDPDGTRVSVMRLTKNLGPAGARNLALAQATGTFVAVLDADDFMLPGRLERLLAQADGFDLVADDLCLSGEAHPLTIEGRLIGLPADHVQPLDLVTFVEGNITRPGHPRREMGFIKPLLRREFLLAKEISYIEGLRLGEDYILYAQALARGARAKLVSATGYVAVRREGSLSGSHSNADLQNFYDACCALGAETKHDRAAQKMIHRHAVSIRRRLAHVDTLAMRKSKGSVAAFSTLARQPSDIPYVVLQTLRDKLSARSPSRGADD